MKAILCQHYCEPEDLSIGNLAEPNPSPTEVLIEVHSVALNFPDLLMIQGKYQYKSNFPFAPGMECAGVVRKIGSKVKDIKVGQRVVSHPWRNCLAELVISNENEVFPIPESMEFHVAAGFSIAYGTAYHALIDRGRIKKNDVMLVLGASGGVGLASVELGKFLGATVIAAASNKHKLDLTRHYGADHLIDYTEDRLKERVNELTSNRGADVIFDPVGGDLTDESVRCINWRGRLLIVGFASGRIAKIPANLTLLKGSEIIGVAYHRFFMMEPEIGKENMMHLLGMYSQGNFRPHHSINCDLEDTPKAMRTMADRKSAGKIIINVH